MKISHVLTACNTLNMYLQCIPIFIETWKKILPQSNILIILISNEIPLEYIKYKNYIILFNPIENVSDVFISQFIRILYPSFIKSNDGVLITDIDMLPVNSKYFCDSIKNINNNFFISYRTSNQISICYNVATPKIWNDVLGIDNNNILNINTYLSNIFLKCDYKTKHKNYNVPKSWFIDQEHLTEKVYEFNKKTKKFISFKDKDIGFNRIEQNILDVSFEMVINNLDKFSDFYVPRPYSNYIEKINTFINNISDNNFLSGEKFQLLCDISFYEQSYLTQYPNILEHCNKYILIDKILPDDIIDILEKSTTFFVKTDYIHFFETKILPLINKNFILITHNSDLLSGLSTNIINNKYLVKWYGQNMATLNEKLVGIPIGLENSQWKGFNYNFLKKYKLSEKQNLLYINFNINTNKKREDIINLFKSKNFDINPRLEWNDYIKEMSTYKYVLSPSGCGEDCHRIWESLYLGCIPIVLKTDVLYTYFNNT